MPNVIETLMAKVADRSEEEQRTMAEKIMFAKCLWEAIQSQDVPLRIVRQLESKTPFEDLSIQDAVLVAKIAKEHAVSVSRATCAAAEVQRDMDNAGGETEVIDVTAEEPAEGLGDAAREEVAKEAAEKPAGKQGSKSGRGKAA